MVREAEDNREADVAQREQVDARNGLEQYCYNVRNTLSSSDELKDKIGEEDAQTIVTTVDEALVSAVLKFSNKPWVDDGCLVAGVARGRRARGEHRGADREAEGGGGQGFPHHAAGIRGGKRPPLLFIGAPITSSAGTI